MAPDFMLLDVQLARYFWCAEEMGYTPLRGVLFNEIRTKPPSIPPQLRSGGISTAKKYDTDLFTLLAALKSYGLDPNDYPDLVRRAKANTVNYFRRTPMPKDKTLTVTQLKDLLMTAREMKTAEALNHFPRTVMKSCDWDCDYKDPCIVQLFGGDIEQMLKKNYQQRGRRDV
jgi:hypothetical protein